MADGKNKKSFMESLMDFAFKIAEPLGQIADTPVISSIQNGLVAIMPVIIVGSLFLVLYVLGSPSVGTSGHALLPFLTPLAGKFVWVNSITLGFMSLYASITFAESYAEKLNVDTKSASILGVVVFICFTIAGVDKSGGIAVTAFSGSGLFVSIITSLVSVKIYAYLLKKNITIKMPASVPPNIGNAFTSLIPYAVCMTLAWLVRDLMNFDMVAWLSKILSPLVQGGDNVVTCGVVAFVTNLLWSVGLHGDNMFGSLFTPFGTIWLQQNASALSAGTPTYALPHVLAGLGNTGLLRLTNWTATVWPLIAFMIMSKVKYLKSLGWACLPAGIFTIVEPVVFGLPLALNPTLFIPFLLSGTISAIVGYLIMALPFMGKFFAAIPWATPPFLLGPLGTGDWKTIFIPIISFAIGFVIYYPFWKAFEKECLQKEKEREAELQQANQGYTV